MKEYIPSIKEVIAVETGGYRSWVIVQGYGACDIMTDGEKIYHLHPVIDAHEEIAVPLGVPVGTRVAGVRWTEDATPESLNRYCLD